MSSESKQKKGLFSWLGFGKNKDPSSPESAVILDAEVQHEQPDVVTQPSPEQIEKLNTASVSDSASVETAPVVLDDQMEQALAEATAAASVASGIALSISAPQQDSAVEAVAMPVPLPESKPVSSVVEPPKAKGWLTRLKEGLKRTRSQLGDGLASLFLGRKTIDDELFEELETQLVMADVGLETTSRLLAELTQEVSRKELKDASVLLQSLKLRLKAILQPVTQPLQVDMTRKPYLILVVGVNGAGKTTTIGKLAKHLQQQGQSVMLAAGDTFRAAAVEQLQVWGQRNQIPVIAQHTGADSASVIFDALQAAKARQIDVLIADTAGRLHNKAHLMDELKKVVRVIGKQDPTAPHEVMLVLDATIGQNALSQAEHFVNSVGVNSLALTKLDGTAKGGIIFALADRFKLPIRFIGVGEQLEDLRPFDGDEFVDALFDQN